MKKHGVFLVPVRVDLDGTLLVVCPGVDGDLEAHYWAGWCSACNALVTGEPVQGTVGVQSIDGLSDDQYDVLEEQEHELSQSHAALFEAAEVVRVMRGRVLMS